MTTYAIWFPFEMPPHRDFKDMSCEFEVLGHRASINKHLHLHILKLNGIESEHDATALIPHLSVALRWAALSTGIGLQVVASVDEVTWRERRTDEDGSDGTSEADEGVFRGNMICVYPEDKEVKKITGGTVGILQSYPAKSFGAAIHEGMKKIDFDLVGGKMNLALELYCMADFELSPQAKYLSLCMALEVVAPHPATSKAALDQIDHWIAEANDNPNADIKGLANRLGNLRSESHRQAVQSFVKAALTADGDSQAADIAREARDLYDARGMLVHKGKVEVGQKAPRLKEIVSRTLGAAILHGLAGD